MSTASTAEQAGPVTIWTAKVSYLRSGSINRMRTRIADESGNLARAVIAYEDSHRNLKGLVWEHIEKEPAL